MDPADVSTAIRTAFEDIISMDEEKRKTAILRCYDQDCRLQNPYLVLQGREEIIRSYTALATNNTSLSVQVDTVTYDEPQQTCLADMRQVIRPKALGGLVSINMHQILKLQLERNEEDGLLRIVDHHEIHVAQDLLSQVPIVGSFYEQGLRNAVGQLSIAGSSFLSYTGLLDLVPAAVQKTRDTATAVRERAGQLAATATKAGSTALNATGVNTMFGGVVSAATDFAKRGAAQLMEQGRGEQIACYSPSCVPGQVCYVPTCPRSRSYAWLSRDSVKDIVKGVYVEAYRRVGFFSPTSSQPPQSNHERQQQDNNNAEDDPKDHVSMDNISNIEQQSIKIDERVEH